MKQKRSSFEDYYFRKLDFLENRIDNLSKEGKFLEIILWFGLIFEAELTILLSYYEQIIKDTGEVYGGILEEYQPRSTDEIRKQKKSLGKLKEELGQYLFHKNKKLNEQLKEFIDLRNRIIHQFFESQQNPSFIEGEIKSRKLLENWWKLAWQLSEEMKRLLEERNRLLKLKLLKKIQKK